eukprot:SAG11_NODE_286_length_11220_cov_11.922399_6_plen_174_part_00
MLPEVLSLHSGLRENCDTRMHNCPGRRVVRTAGLLWHLVRGNCKSNHPYPTTTTTKTKTGPYLYIPPTSFQISSPLLSRRPPHVQTVYSCLTCICRALQSLGVILLTDLTVVTCVIEPWFKGSAVRPSQSDQPKYRESKVYGPCDVAGLDSCSWARFTLSSSNSSSSWRFPPI